MFSGYVVFILLMFFYYWIYKATSQKIAVIVTKTFLFLPFIQFYLKSMNDVCTSIIYHIVILVLVIPIVTTLTSTTPTHCELLLFFIFILSHKTQEDKTRKSIFNYNKFKSTTNKLVNSSY
jgi:hypothetical protein